MPQATPGQAPGYTRKEPRVEEREKAWDGTPLDLAVSGIDPYGIEEIVIEFGEDETEVLRPRLRGEFQSYELEQAAHYIEALVGHISARQNG
jgi:hypothetical protein